MVSQGSAMYHCTCIAGDNLVTHGNGSCHARGLALVENVCDGVEEGQNVMILQVLALNKNNKNNGNLILKILE